MGKEKCACEIGRLVLILRGQNYAKSIGMIQIYFLDRVIRLLTEAEKGEDRSPEVPVLHANQEEDLPVRAARFEAQTQEAQLDVVVEDPEAALPGMFRDFQQIEAAGGLVRNELGHYLFICRHGLWDLPKGKHEAGEGPAQTAWREVAEECGLQGHKICGLCHVTYHCYRLFDKPVLKKTWWYHMQAASTEVLKPQVEEDIHQACWVAPQDLPACRARTYASIREVLDCALPENV